MNGQVFRIILMPGLQTHMSLSLLLRGPLISYSATQQMDEALVGRFATFVYIRDVLEMEEVDRIKVAETINGDDCLGMSEWLDHVDREIKTVQMESTLEAGVKIIALLKKAAVHFKTLKQNMGTLSEFLAKYADLVMRETKGEISLDGRRLGFIYRNLLANRAIELAPREKPDRTCSTRPMPHSTPKVLS